MKKENDFVSVELKSFNGDDQWWIRLSWREKQAILPLKVTPDEHHTSIPLSVAELLFPDSPAVAECKKKLREKTAKDIDDAQKKILSLKKVVEWAENR